MGFPEDNIRAEMLINGTWTEVTNKVRGGGDITISSGTRIDSTDLAPSSIDFTLDNTNGLFTNDNPMSQYFGLLPANTNFRVAMEESAPFLYLPNTFVDADLVELDSAYVSTTDKAVLDVTGDLDIRIDFEPDTWQLGNVGQTLAGKWNTGGDQRSWALTIESNGALRFWWSTAGSIATIHTADSTVSLPATGRISARVTIDVNNGASGRTVTFYTSDSITGTYTQLGAAVTTAGTTSIFSSSAILQVGAVGTASNGFDFAQLPGAFNPNVALVGRVHRFRMYNGIAGTEVADMNATLQAEGATSWADGLGTPNTWTTRLSTVTVADYRGYGEMAEMPQEWDITGTDVHTSVAVAGISRRITKDSKSIQSAYRRVNERYATSVGYWSMEDPSGSTTAFTSTPGASIAGSNGLGFGSQYFPQGSAPLADISSVDSFVVYQFAKNLSLNSGWTVSWVARYQPFTDNPLPLLMTMDCADGTDIVVTLDVAAKTIEIFAQTPAGSIIADVTHAYTEDWAEWHTFYISSSASGGTVSLNLAWQPMNLPYGNATEITDTYAGTTSTPDTARFGGGDVPPGSTVGHVIGVVGDTDNLFSEERFNAFRGWVGETAAARWLRICREEGIVGLLVGWPNDTQTMGPQPSKSVVDVLDECVATDSGLHYEARNQAALVFRTRASLYLQQPVVLDYSLKHLSGLFRPTDDDLLTKNSVTATNPDDSFAISTVTSGSKSTQSSPSGVGLYDSSLSVNTYDLPGLQDAASEATYRGTWSDRRVPNVEVQLARSVYTTNATLTRALRSIGLGDRLTIAHVPIWVGGNSADTLIRSYVEKIQNSGVAKGWSLAFGTVPGGPFAAVPQLGNNQFVTRLDATAHTTGGTMTTTSTSVTFVTPTRSAVWVNSAGYPAEFPFDVFIGGERMTVTAITGTTSPQTATVTRSVNAIVKIHASGEGVRLAVPYFVGR